ncbi:DsbE family thiol:disulfide interchange protein [Enterovibrio nigricans]|uniref:Cytochrome c biogenesis protein CcmG, thiol:disulfide interchange protein DsbE n=1 Tax=Enterovibrio nigricans DSM 22720 TaxID=1121868 RepID=A0A1T4VZB6_9GAMM|nr:DsbE family thiol:disulfide interchange protein [Enterovibrio nigricans]SKA70326.1 cytochrome c biogenesis protein CcmG, thiol:disulfide interchange protein DsbE [Enterovibrio nigricans DSM 22720]
MINLRFSIPLAGAIAFIVALSWMLVNTDNDEAPTQFAMKGQTVPTFSYATLENELVDETVLKGKWTLLNVWASWCVVCKKEHDFLMTLSRQGVPIIGLNYRDRKEAALNTLKHTGNPYRAVIFDPSGALAIEFGSLVTPDTYLIDEHGTLIHRHTGELNNEVWETEFLPRIQPAQHRHQSKEE